MSSRLSLLIRALSPSWGPSSCPQINNILPDDPPLNIITLSFRASTYESGLGEGHTNIQYRALFQWCFWNTDSSQADDLVLLPPMSYALSSPLTKRGLCILYYEVVGKTRRLSIQPLNISIILVTNFVTEIHSFIHSTKLCNIYTKQLLVNITEGQSGGIYRCFINMQSRIRVLSI